MVRIRIGDEERELSWEEWEQRVRQGRVPPDAEVAIDAVTEGAFVPAQSLETYQSLRNDAALAWQSRFLAGPAPILTALLVGVNIRVWWFAQARPAREFLVTHFTNWTSPALEDGEAWRTLTMGLLHTEAFHLVMNMLWLAYTGWNLERALGRLNLAVIFVASVLGGSLLSMFASPETPSLGASGGVFGLVAASVAFGFTRPELLPARGRRVFGLAMLPYLLIMFWSGLMNEGTDNWSHFGGLVTGGLLAMILDPEPLQRRPGWNNTWRLSVGGAVVGVLLVLGLLGPRIHPLLDEQVAQQRLMAQRGAPLVRVATLPEPASYRPLAWSVPAGWSRGSTASGDLGYASPAPEGSRAWSVDEHEHDAPATAEAIATEWTDDLLRGWPEAEIGPLRDATVAGRPGKALRVTVEGGEAVLEWRGAVRGVRSVQAVWQVDADTESRLEPLHQRLLDDILWRPPEALAQARATVERNPRTRRGRARLAEALADIGEAEEAAALYRELIDEDPEEADWWLGLLKIARWYPQRVGAFEQIAAEALRAAPDPDPELVLGVVDGLEARGDDTAAVGLLELAWARVPGERSLRRARRRRDLPVEHDPATNLPRHLAVDPWTGAPRPEHAEAFAARPLTLDEARQAGAERAARRDEIAEQVLAALGDDRDRAVDGLLVLRHGAIPLDRDEAVKGLGEELRTLERRGRLPWLPEILVAPLVDSGLAADLAPRGD